MATFWEQHRRRGNGRLRTLRLAAMLFPFLSAAPGMSAAPVAPLLLLESRVTPGGLEARLSVTPGEDLDRQRREIIDNLTRGLRAEIVFQLRIYAPGRGLVALLGDELIAEATITRVARWDPFDRRYVMEELGDDEARRTVSEQDPQRLLDAFFAAERAMEVTPLWLPPAGAYLSARYRLSPVLVDGTLRIVSLFFDVGTRTSAWARRSLGEAP